MDSNTTVQDTDEPEAFVTPSPEDDMAWLSDWWMLWALGGVVLCMMCMSLCVWRRMRNRKKELECKWRTDFQELPAIEVEDMTDSPPPVPRHDAAPPAASHHYPKLVEAAGPTDPPNAAPWHAPYLSGAKAQPGTPQPAASAAQASAVHHSWSEGSPPPRLHDGTLWTPTPARLTARSSSELSAHRAGSPPPAVAPPSPPDTGVRWEYAKLMAFQEQLQRQRQLAEIERRMSELQAIDQQLQQGQAGRGSLVPPPANSTADTAPPQRLAPAGYFPNYHPPKDAPAAHSSGLERVDSTGDLAGGLPVTGGGRGTPSRKRTLSAKGGVSITVPHGKATMRGRGRGKLDTSLSSYNGSEAEAAPHPLNAQPPHA